MAGVRAAALDVAVRRALTVAQTINGGGSAQAALELILGACGVNGVADLAHVRIAATEDRRRGVGLAVVAVGRRVGPLGQDPKLERAASHLVRKSKRLVQVAEGLRITVAAEAAVGKEEVTRARVLREIVLQRDLERVFEERERLLPVTAAEQDGRLSPESFGQRFR